MKLELKQHLKLSQHLVITPQLQLSLRLLAMNRQELAQTLQAELLENPTLEEDTNTSTDDIDWLESIEPFLKTNTTSADMAELPSIEQTLSQDESLKEHLLWQIQMSDMNIVEREIAECLLDNLDDNGYLDIHSICVPLLDPDPQTDLPRPTKKNKLSTKERLKFFEAEFSSIVKEDKPAQPIYFAIKHLAEQLDVPADWVENVRNRIMHYDPVGCLAGNLRECLLAQLEVMGLDKKTAAFQIVDRHLGDLENHNYRGILSQLHIKEAELSEALKLIEHLEPNPARAFISLYVKNSQFITPDIFLTKNGDKFSITLNENGLPKLRINHFYIEQLKKHKKDASTDFIQEKVRAALWLTKAIFQRQNTIIRVMQSIIEFQQKWFLEDLPLRPLTLREVADEIGMHESTVSRVTSRKYALTPKGLFELKYFFSAAITTDKSDGIAGEAVKEMIKKILATENPQHPLSDSRLVLALAKQNIFIARRTVAKYRESLHILPSHQRKRWQLSSTPN